MRECAARMRKPLHGLTPAAERLLLSARWDGNVRELKNVVERACMLADGTLMSERELAGAFGPERAAPRAARRRGADRGASDARRRRRRSKRSSAITSSTCCGR